MIHVFDTNGNSTGKISSWKRLSVSRSVNAPAEVTLELDARDKAIECLGLDFQCQVWREPTWFPPYKEVDCLFRTPSWSWDSSGHGTYTARMYGLESLLGRRVLLGGDDDYYYDGTYSAEKCMKVTAAAQCGVSRDLAKVAIPGFTVLDSADRGSTYSGYQKGTNLLQHLQNIATTCGMCFKVSSDTPMDFIFDAWPSPYGTDRTIIGLGNGRNAAGVIPLIFSLQHGNVSSLQYAETRDTEGTVAVDLDSRTELYGSNYSDSPLNHWEVAVHPMGSQQPKEAALYALEQTRARSEVKATVLQTRGCAYGRDYFLGDWVTVVVNGPGVYRELTQVITGVAWTVEYQEGRPAETIEIELTAGMVRAGNALSETLSNLTRRIKYLELSA